MRNFRVQHSQCQSIVEFQNANLRGVETVTPGLTKIKGETI